MRQVALMSALGLARPEMLGSFAAAKRHELLRAVRGAISGPDAMVEDACGFAWCQLCQAEHVSLDDTGFAWLYVVALREAYRLSDRSRREPASGAPNDLDVPELAAGPAEIAERQEAARGRLRLLAGIPPRRQQLVILHAAGFRYQEIAALTGDSLRAVERQLLRGKHTLREAAQEAAHESA